MRRCAIMFLLLALASCAAPPRGFDISPPAGETPVYWPPVASGEPVRYRLLGQITGETDFRAYESGNSSWAGKTLRWLVGLNESSARHDGLQRPHSVLVDALGRIIVTDISRRDVLVFDPQASRMLRWPTGQVPGGWLPIGLASGDGGSLLVTDAEGARVHRIDPDGRYLGHFGTGILVRPTGITRDAVSRLIYVADTRAHDIKVFGDDGRLIDTIAGPGAGPGRLNSPTSIAWSGKRLYVVDAMNARVQVFDGDGNSLQSIGRRGHYVGNFAIPKGLAVDRDGNVYVTESRHDRLLIFTPEGRFALAIGETGSAGTAFYLPAGVWVDDSNRVLVADMFNGRVSVFQYLGSDR